jgi:hypothetical protein
MPTSLCFQRIQHFIGHYNIVCDKPPWHESTLRIRNDQRQDIFKPISKHLRDDLIHITKALWPIVSHFLGRFGRRDQCNVGKINFSQQMT